MIFLKSSKEYKEGKKMKYRVVEAKRKKEIKGRLKSNYIAGHIQYKYTKESSLKKMVGLNF